MEFMLDNEAILLLGMAFQFSGIPKNFGEIKLLYHQQTEGDFVLFWNSTAIENLRENGLLML